jgi:hypothetical protein
MKVFKFGGASVKDAAAVGEPCGAAAAGGVLDARDAVGQAFTGVGAEEVERAVFAAVFGETDGDEFAIGGGYEPIHGDLAFGFEFVRVEDDAFGGEVVRGCQGDEETRLFGRLEFQGEEDAGAGD